MGRTILEFTGLFGMVQASWLPAQMRLIHTIELFADAMAYSCVLALLFGTYSRFKTSPVMRPSPTRRNA